MATLIHPRFHEGEVNEGERLLVSFLEAQLPSDYYLVPNVHLTATNPRNGDTQTHEYDMVVVAPHAVYCLENKHWAGQLTGDDNGWYLNRRAKGTPIKTISHKAKVLASKLKDQEYDWGRAWCAHGITLSHPTNVSRQLEGDAANLTFGLDRSLVYFLTTPTQANARCVPNRIRDLQTEIVNYLTGFQEAFRPEPKIVESEYELLDTLHQTPDYTDYMARPRQVQTPIYKRVREYVVEIAGLTEEQKQYRIGVVKNQYGALQRIGNSPYIMRVDWQDDPDRGYFYEISDYLDNNTLRTALGQQTLSFAEQLNLLRYVAEALRAAHRERVYHRDVCPENIYLKDNFAYLANFSRSFYWNALREGRGTVMPSLHDEELTAYQPIELQQKEDAGIYTDVYSLSVVTYELLVGQLPFQNFYGLDHLGGRLPAHLLPSAVKASLPAWLDSLLADSLRLNPDERIQTIDEWLLRLDNGLAEASRQSGLSAVATPQLSALEIKAGVKDSGYLFLESLGTGGFSTVWKVKHQMQGTQYALKVFNESVAAASVIDEFEALTRLSHPNIVKFVWNGSLSNGQFYTLMELLEGDCLKEYALAGERRLPWKSIYQLATDLGQALVHLQAQNCYHRDIKPHNIIWHRNERFVLIDFNVAATAANLTSEHVGTSPYLAPDRNHGSSIEWTFDCDTFSLGVSLYELVCKKYPWASTRVPTVSTLPVHPQVHESELSDAFAAFLWRAIQPKAEDRFQTAQEMLQALEAIGVSNLTKTTASTPAPLSTSDFVRELNKLFSQSRFNNAGTRGLDEFARTTYIQTKLDTKLKDDILTGRFRLVIITGNAGDGKTAFLQQLEESAKALTGHYQTLPTNNGARFRIGNRWYESNYDGSQDESERSNDEVLKDFFAPFENLDDLGAAPEGRIIAINEGRLVEYLQQTPALSKLSDVIEKYFYSEGTTNLPESALIINLNARSVVGTTDPQESSIFREQVRKITHPTHWQGCENCALKDNCFIRANAQTLHDAAAGEEIITRMEWLLRTLHLRRDLHITMRDIRSFIAFWIARDYHCDDMETFAQKPLLDRLSYYYFNLSDHQAQDAGQQDRLLRLLRTIDVGQVLIPAQDRELYFKTLDAKQFLPFTDRHIELVEWLNHAKHIATTAEDQLRLHQLLKRYAYFEGKYPYMERNPYRNVTEFRANLIAPLDEQSEQKAEREKRFMQGVAKAISLVEGCQNKKIYETYLVLAAGDRRERMAKSYRLFEIADFELVAESRPRLENYMEFHPAKIIFRHKIERDISLHISLDLFEMLSLISVGYLPSLNELKGQYVELDMFKHRLESLPYERLLVTKDNRQYFNIYADTHKNIHIEKIEKWQ